jgi:hypothetical protein
MLQIRQVKHLAGQLKTSTARLREVAESVSSYCEELTLLDPAKPGRPRDVLNVTGALRTLQTQLLRRVLLPKLTPSEFSHGGIRGRHIKSNIQPHIESVFVFTTDISNFYPTVSRNRVYDLFATKLGCSPDVARICTRLCTYRHHLALGLVTSPILAEQVLGDVDLRIAGVCQQANAVYSRFVDDITISSSFDLERSGLPNLVESILGDHGFSVNRLKNRFGRISDGVTITKIRVKNGHPDVQREYLVELERQLDDVASLAAGKGFQGPYYTKSQIGGRVQFVCWVNPNRRRRLLRWYRSIPWERVEQAARQGLLIANKKVLTKRT